MIQKVNRPPILELVRTSKGAENDPGSSSGSGNFYEAQPDLSQPPAEDKKDEKTQDEKITTGRLSLVVSIEQSGMTEVVKDLLDLKNQGTERGSSPGLSTRYSSDASSAKGLLLNKKAE